MTATFLQSELSSLIQDAKKKHPEVKAAADKSLGDLKGLSVTSESQLAGDLLRRPHFIDPFILACKSRNVKLAGSGVICLQRLTASRGVPRERLTDLLDAFRDVASSSMDIQLKILQTLPSLLQLYEEDLRGNLLAATLEVCGMLQSSKTVVISSTAAATFQQLTTTVFERVDDDDHKQKAEQEEGFEPTAVSDALRLLHDLCALVNNEKPDFVQINAMSPQFLLEVIGSILTNHESVFSRHSETIETCRTLLLPAITRILTEKINFPVAVRVLRILYVLISRHLDAMESECQQAMSAMIKLLDPDHSPMWKRILCMEVIRAICQEAALLPRMFELFDQGESKTGTIASLLAAFARIASEDPSTIGLGRQSTVPSKRGGFDSNNEDIMVETAGVGGAIGSVVSADITVTGISMEWSTVRSPYMEQLDKAEPMDVPATYIYGLIINCLVAVSEGLSKFVMPLSLPSKGQSQRVQEAAEENGVSDSSKQNLSVEKTRPSTPGAQKYQRLINPLNLKGHPRIGAVRVCADLIHACWPAFLATCSTFLYSALDSTFYHNLVRAFQKMTQVSGVLELSTPRDAFLTCLGKAATPINTYSLVNLTPRDQGKAPEDSSTDEKGVLQTPTFATPRQSVDLGRSLLSIRNLLCMRALLNLGVALGPTLNTDSWFIVIETLLQVEVAVAYVPKRPASSGSLVVVPDMDSEEIRTTLGAETVAVRTAAKRMFESTRGYSDEAFSVVVNALLKLARPTKFEASKSEVSTPVSPMPGSGRGREDRVHQASRSVSGFLKNRQQQEQEVSFVLTKLQDLARLNILRFTSQASKSVSWDLIVVFLLSTARSYETTPRLRIEAAGVCNVIVAEAIDMLNVEETNNDESENLRAHGLSALLAQLQGLEHPDSSQRQEDRATDDKMHGGVLEALESIIGQSGESLRNGWATVFEILRLTFKKAKGNVLGESSITHSSERSVQAWSPTILQVAFRSLQLIVSDFLGLFALQLLAELTDVLLLFGTQSGDLNISLTTSGFFGGVASLIQGRLSIIELKGDFRESTLMGVLNINDKDSAGALWMLLVSRLSMLCLDRRQEVRNSAMQMMFRILEASGSTQTGAAWNGLISGLILERLRHYHYMSMELDVDTLRWQSSISQVLAGMTDISVRHIEVIATDQSFSGTWGKLLNVLELLLSENTLNVWALVFATISRLLKGLRSSGVSRNSYAVSALRLFLAYHPADMVTRTDDGSVMRRSQGEVNQEALLQHASVFAEAFTTLKDVTGDSKTTEDVDPEQVMQSLRSTIFGCSHPQYTSDLKNMAPEQEKVVTILPMLRELMDNKRSAFAEFLLEFVKAPLLRAAESVVPSSGASGSKPAQKPSFVAFSTKCIDILDLITSSFQEKDSILRDLSVSASINTLAAMMNTRYSTAPQNPDSPVWRAASRAANNMISATVQNITHFPQQTPSAGLEDFLSATTVAAAAMLNTPGLNSLPTQPTTKTLLDDETFDISTFQSLHTSLVRILGISAISDDIRKTYIVTVFNASLVAKPWFFDIPDNILNKPLERFSTVRMGTVCAPVFLPRQRICYTALDALFGLAAKHPEHGTNGEPPEIEEQSLTIARTAAPYLLLRIGHAFKTFIADQPLRSLTPLPRPLRIELLTLLTNSLSMCSEDAAFSALTKEGSVSAASGDGKSHLRILYPLLLRLQEKWAWCPRLSGGVAWQEGLEGRKIEEQLKDWNRFVACNWGLVE